MIENTHKGLFIVFEGLDGSGAEVQASLLAAVLAKEGYRVHLTKEPTNNLVGGLIKGKLTGEWQANAECLQLLFAADRAHHLEKEIVPHLSAGHIVITDRYALSSIAYGSLDTDSIKWLEAINSRFILPDLTFLIKVRPKICATRLKQSRYELELFQEEQKLDKVWKVYEELSNRYHNINMIDGERDEMEIIKEIVVIINKRLGIAKK